MKRARGHYIQLYAKKGEKGNQCRADCRTVLQKLTQNENWYAYKQLKRLLNNFLLKDCAKKKKKKDSMQESFLAVNSTFWETGNLMLEKQIQSTEKYAISPH